MAKYKIKSDASDGDFHSSESTRGRSFGAGDFLVILLALILIAVLVLLATRSLPRLRADFEKQEEEIFLKVEYPVKSGSEESLPKKDDPWVLLDSDGAIFTVHSVELSYDQSVCRVLLKRKVSYREGHGYSVEDKRIAIGTTLYFRKDLAANQVAYFAVSVVGLHSARFPEVTTEALPAVTTSPEAESLSPETTVTADTTFADPGMAESTSGDLADTTTEGAEVYG